MMKFERLIATILVAIYSLVAKRVNVPESILEDLGLPKGFKTFVMPVAASSAKTFTTRLGLDVLALMCISSFVTRKACIILDFGGFDAVKNADIFGRLGNYSHFIVHELVHARQMQTLDGINSIKGEAALPYNERASEIEAFSVQADYASKFPDLEF